MDKTFMSTPTKAEKEVPKHHHAMQFICKRCDNRMQFLMPCEHFDTIKALEARLRMAEEENGKLRQAQGGKE
jgi:hypothetical protein